MIRVCEVAAGDPLPTRAPSAPQPNLTESLNYLDHHHDDVDDDDDDAYLMMVEMVLLSLATHGMPTKLDPIIWYQYDNEIYHDDVDDCKQR